MIPLIVNLIGRYAAAHILDVAILTLADWAEKRKDTPHDADFSNSVKWAVSKVWDSKK